MCGRFGLFEPQPEIERRFSAEFSFDYEPRYNIAPEGPGIAAIQNERPDEINQLTWGLVPHWADDLDDWPSPINARAENIAEKPAFREAFRERRCLIPANTFYEWGGRRGSRIPHTIGVEDQTLFAMAGLWETWSENGDEVQSVAIVTTGANDVVGQIHDRMPVILDADEEARWLEADDEAELEALLDPFPGERTRSHEVSRAVNDPANDRPELIEPVGSDQSELGRFS